MVISEGILEEINEQAILYDASISKIKARIESKIRVAIGKLDSIKNELLDEVERELGRNPFAEFLSNKDKCTDAGAKRLLDEQKIPENFGPDEKSFSTLLKEIDSFRAWQNNLNPLNFIPKELRVNNVTCDSIALSWTAVNSDCIYEIELRSSTSLKSVHHSDKSEYTFYNLKPGTEHHIRVRAVFICNGIKCVWSNPITVKTKCLYKGVWKVCPDDVDDEMKYSVDEENPRIATKINDGYGCTIIGNTPIPLDAVTQWNIKILKSRDNDGYEIFIGIAPSDINQNNSVGCGWYFNCYYSKLYSGPPHNYSSKEYGPRKEIGRYARTGDSVGVVMDTTKGDLLFVLNGVDFGVAYEGIPLDKPLVPCINLGNKGDSVELII